MEILSSQIYPFFYSISSGIFIAFLYDIFRIKRKVVGSGKISILIEDFLYWLFAGIIIFITIFCGCNGILRGYIFIGIIFGVILYIVVLSKSIIKFGIFLLTEFLRPIFFIISKFQGIFKKSIE
jgi:spore cortex biosynthesis protein YabQ